MRRAGAKPANASAPAVARDDTLRLACVLAFATVGLEQALHTSGSALAAQPLYQALHWLSCSLLALPLAAVAVWGGECLAARLGRGCADGPAIVARVCLTGLLFALLLVPGAALHELADTLTHTHPELAIQLHDTLTPRQATDPAAWVGFARHALADAIAGLVVGLPLLYLALRWPGGAARRPRQRGGTRRTG